MAVATGEIWQMVYQMAYRSQTVENVIHFRERTGLSTIAQVKQSAADFWSLMRPFIVGDVVLTQIICKQVTPTALDQQFGAANSGETAGSSSGAGVALTVALVLTLRTGVAGKTHRGRIYVPGFSLGQAIDSGDKVNPSVQSTLNTQADAILTEFGDASGTDTHLALGIYSRLIGGTSPYTLAGWQAVEQIVVQPILGNQRRRRPGVGV